MVGEIKLQDLTLEEARAAILAKYAGILHQPAITLTLKEFNKPFAIGSLWILRFVGMSNNRTKVLV